MEIGIDIARLIIESRNTNVIKDGQNFGNSTVKEVEHILLVDSIVNIQTLLVHRRCQHLGINCEAAIPIELWTLQICAHNPESTVKVLDPLFLKNAIRSHLHFSQLNSWMTSNGGKLPNDLVFVYKLGCDTLDAGINCCMNSAVRLENDLPEKHVFPTVKYGLKSLLTVSVMWRKFFVPPSLRNCLSFKRNSFYERVLPVESTKSNIYRSDLTSMKSSSTSSTTGHHFCSDDDENSSGVFSASNSSSDSALEKHERAEIERSTKKRSFENEEGDKPFSKKAVTGIVNKEEDCSIAKKVKSAEVEDLTNVFAEASSLSNISDQIVCSRLMSKRQSTPRRYRTLQSFHFISNSPTAFSKKTGLPLNSSPAPFCRHQKKRGHFLLRSIERNEEDSDSGSDDSALEMIGKTSTGLLCNFEESVLNGRLKPFAAVRGYRLQITASGSFCAPHLTLPVEAFFFNFSGDNAPSPNFGRCSLEDVGRKGYHIPKKGLIQATLFNPQGTVVCLFVAQFDVTEMPPFYQTFLRQRQFFMPPECPYEKINRSWLRYLIHLRLATDRRCRVYIHGDIRVLFSQKSDLDAVNTTLNDVGNYYTLRSFTEMPQKPRFSPRK
uniref:DUF4210 domain-containing protein n=1 Tax=Syphacia muris TaxID=451379 RepID=A0A0N5ABG1_9BILA